MTDKEYIRNLRLFTDKDPLRILTSACLIGEVCGVDGSSYGEYPCVLKLIKYKNVKIMSFCPEDYSFGTPREICDIHGGTGIDVLNGAARVITSSGIDWTDGMIEASYKMLSIAQKENIELSIMMDISAACGSQVIYNGNRLQKQSVYQIGMGICAAQLLKNGFKIISQRDFNSLEILYSKIDDAHKINKYAKDHNESDWYVNYFNIKQTHGTN